MSKKFFILVICWLFDKSFGMSFTIQANFFICVIHNGSLNESLADVRYAALLQIYNKYSENQWMFYSFRKLNFEIETDETVINESTNITASTGYFRFVNKLQPDYCVIFLLLTYSLQDTVDSIHRSGFGSSEYALFLIPVTSFSDFNSDLLVGFKHELISNTTDFEPFSTNIVFYVPTAYRNNTKPLVALFCYACSRYGNPVVQISATRLDEILLVSMSINVNMQKNTVLVKHPYAMRLDTKCLQLHSPFVTKQTYDSLIPCSQWQTGWPAFGHYINATLVSTRYKMNKTEALYGKWLTRVTIALGSLHTIPEEFALERGMYSPIVAREARLFVCIYSQSLAVFDSSIRRLIPLDIFACIVVCIGFYVAIYSSFVMAFKLFWHFLGLTAKISKRARKTTWLTVALAGTVGISWQAGISADALAFTSFPSERKLLVDMKYKIWVPMRWIMYWKNNIGDVLWEKYTHGLYEKIFYDMEKHPKSHPWNLTETFHTMALRRLTFWNIQNWGLMDNIWNRPMLLKDSVVCQAVPFDRNGTSYYVILIELSGVSAKAKRLARRWIEVGLALTDKIYDRTFTRLFGTGIIPVHGFSKPMPLAISGVLGTCMIFTVSIKVLILISWLLWYQKHFFGFVIWYWNIWVWHVKDWKRRLQNRFGYLGQPVFYYLR